MSVFPKKNDFLGNALALLFPIDWPEPFGLVMIEALACGTPVIARSRGSVPEIIEHGRTGFVINSIEEAVLAVQKIPQLSRRECRKAFEQRFSATRMALDYIAVYEQVVQAWPTRELKPSLATFNQPIRNGLLPGRSLPRPAIRVLS